MTLAQNSSSFSPDFAMPVGSPTSKAINQGLTGNHSNMVDMALQHATRNSQTPPEALFGSQDAQDEEKERSPSPRKSKLNDKRVSVYANFATPQGQPSSVPTNLQTQTGNSAIISEALV